MKSATASSTAPETAAPKGKPLLTGTAKELKTKEAVASISKTKPDGDESQEHESLGPQTTNGAAITFGLSRKFTDGNYGSFEYRVSLTMPFNSDIDGALDVTYEATKNWVDEKLTELLGNKG